MMGIRSAPLFADVLVVSDALDFVRRLRLVLQAAGYIVRNQNNGGAVLQAVQANPPDLVLQDVSLSGTDSYQLVRRLKADPSLPFVPIIMISAQGEPVDVAAALDAGADEFMYQSASNTELLTRVRAMLRLKSTTDALAELNATLEQKVAERTQELEQAHARLRHSEKLSSLGRFAATIAHEINNPLTGIIGLVDLIKQDCSPSCPINPTIHQDMTMVEQQMYAIANLVQQLRDFSKPPRKVYRPVDLNNVLQNVLTLIGKELMARNIEVVCEDNPSLPLVLASAEQMGEIFLNLILNAQDAMPNGGTLTIRIVADDTWVQAQVSDTGVGIEPKWIERIFEPYFTTKGEHGTGLGLAICHRIVQDHGGDILVESQPGQGTAFTVRLPKLEV